jgi:hypothetical protein
MCHSCWLDPEHSKAAFNMIPYVQIYKDIYKKNLDLNYLNNQVGFWKGSCEMDIHPVCCS